MAIPTPRTWSLNESVSSANMNSGVRDSITFAMNQPSAIALRTTSQSITNSTDTAISFDNQIFDNRSMFAPTSDTITIQETGVYEITGHLTFTANATGHRIIYLSLTGLRMAGFQIPASSGDTIMCATTQVKAVVGDTVKLIAWQNSGGSLNVTNNYGPRLCVTRLSGD